MHAVDEIIAGLTTDPASLAAAATEVRGIGKAALRDM